MSHMLEQNLIAFLKRYPQAESRLMPEADRSHTWNFKLDTEGRFFDGDYLIEERSPKFWGKFETKPYPVTFQLCFGLGTGYFLQELIKESSKKDTRFLVIEPSAARFLFVLQSVDLRSLFQDQRVHFFVSLSTDQLFSEFARLLVDPTSIFNMNAFAIQRHPRISLNDKHYFEVAENEWAAVRKQVENQMGHIEDSLLGVSNALSNAKVIERSFAVKDLQSVFKNKPAVIASTGPSLNKSLDQLKQVQDRCIIICPDASLRVLLQNGIEPHFVCTLERIGPMAEFFKSLPVPKLKAELVAFPFTPADVFDAYSGPLRLAYRNYGWFKYFEEKVPKGFIASSTSVSHFCVNLAAYLGCQQIYLIGQDLAFDPDSFVSHAKGVAFKEWNQEQTEAQLSAAVKAGGFGELIWVEGNLRERVPSHQFYYSFAKEFSSEAGRLQVELVNCTAGGMRIPMIDWRDFSEVAKSFTPLADDSFEMIKAHRHASDGRLDFESSLTYLKRLLEKMQQVSIQLSQVQSMKSLSVKQWSEAVQSLRESQQALSRDPWFIDWIIQNAGRDLLAVESSLSVMSDSKVHERFALIQEWYSVAMRVASGLVMMLERCDASRSNLSALSS